MTRNLRAEILSQENFPLWNELINSSRSSCLYYTPEYLGVLCAVTGSDFKILGIFQNDELMGGMPLYEERTRFGKYISPRLLLFFNGFILKDFDTKYPSKRTGRQLEILTTIKDFLDNAEYVSMMVKSHYELIDFRPFRKDSWEILITYTYVASLQDLDLLWDQMEQNLKRLVKRCQENQIGFTQDDDFESFFRVHLHTHERKKTKLYLPYDKFKQYFFSLKELGLCRLYHARLPDGKSIATQLVLTSQHPLTHSVCAGADEEYLNLGVNAFLRWKVFEDLHQAGYQANDLTDASLNPVSHFKSQLGADLKVCFAVKRKDSFLYRMDQKMYRYKSRLRNLLRPSG